MAIRVSSLAADAIVLALTFLETRKVLQYCKGMRTKTLMAGMSQQGAVYFMYVEPRFLLLVRTLLMSSTREESWRS